MIQPNTRYLLLSFVCLLSSLIDSAHAVGPVELNFTLPTSDGGSIELKPTVQYRLQVVCFLGCECPLAKLYAGRLNQLADEFSKDDVRFIGINSNPQDSMDDVLKFAADHQLHFPIAKDHDWIAMTKLAATRTPEVYLLDPLGQVIYQGRIDDQYRPGVIQTKPTRDDLRAAIIEALAGKIVTVPRTTAAGCLMAKPRATNPDCDVTYCGQVAAVLSRHCIECHRAGEIGPFALTQYDEVVGWADMILETIAEQRMPPWHASPNHEPLLNARSISTADRELIRRWVEGGTPFGDAKQLPQVPEHTAGWQLSRTPDLVLDVNAAPFRIPAEGTVDYQYFVVNTDFDDDVWVEAAEVFPGNRGVLHHAIAFIRPPDGVDIQGLALLTAYVPGQRIAPATPGLAKRIPAGSKIVFQMHYTPTGTEQFDSSRLGLSIVDKKTVTRESITLLGINHGLEIPPHEANVQVEGASSQFPADGELLSIAPHMHLRGKSMAVQLNQNESSRTILEVPKYDFNWQHTYQFLNPIKLADVRSISFTASYDNSAANPFNPDPSQFVTWGDQTWEEMAVVFYEIARPVVKRKPEQVADVNADNSEHSVKVDERQQKLADQFFADLDSNRDGEIDYDELDLAVKWRLFRRIDKNEDRKLDRAEVLRYVELQHK